MEGLFRMDRAEFEARMQAECRRIMGRIADAVNEAPTGNVIGGSEMQVRDLMAELRQKVYETAVPMRVDSHEATFSPPKDAAGKPKENKGRGRRSVMTSNGRINWSRRRWAGGEEGSDCPVDKLLEETEAAMSVGVRQLCCREGTQARSFARGRENLQHAAQLQVGEDLFRQVVESEGKAMFLAGESRQLELDWSGQQCLAQTPQGQTTTRYVRK